MSLEIPEPPSEEAREEAIRDAKEFLAVWKKRALYSTAAFFLSCVSVWPFLYGYPLQVYWNDFGKYLILLSMALLVPFVVCVGIAVNSWILLLKLRRTNF
jgi:hypothetical protein